MYYYLLLDLLWGISCNFNGGNMIARLGLYEDNKALNT